MCLFSHLVAASPIIFPQDLRRLYDSMALSAAPREMLRNAHVKPFPRIISQSCSLLSFAITLRDRCCCDIPAVRGDSIWRQSQIYGDQLTPNMRDLALRQSSDSLHVSPVRDNYGEGGPPNEDFSGLLVRSPEANKPFLEYVVLRN